MSFVAPYTTMGGKTWWASTCETDDLIWQSHRAPALWWSAPVRIVLKETGVCIAEAKSDEEMVAVWERASEIVDATKEAALCNRLSGWILQEVFADEASRLQEQAEAEATPGETQGPSQKSLHEAPFIPLAVLQEAAKAKSWTEAAELLRSNCEEGEEWWNGKDKLSALHVACAEGRVGLVKNLLGKGADVNVVDHQGWTPLHSACHGNHLACAVLLLDRSETLVMQGTREGSVPLHYLCHHELDTASPWEEVANAILARGCTVNVASHSGETPLMRACFKGRVGAVKWLLKKGGNVRGCLELALRSTARQELVALLLKHNAVVEESTLDMAEEEEVEDDVYQMLQAAHEELTEAAEEFMLVQSAAAHELPSTESPCGICGLPLGDAGPPLGCVVCSKVRCGRCIKTFTSASICLTCAALTAPQKGLFLHTREDVPPSPAAAPAVMGTGPWIWGRLLGVFQGLRAGYTSPGVRDVYERFSLNPDTTLLIDAWSCSIRGVYFHLFAFSSVLCFALSTTETTKSPAVSHPMDMAIELADLTFCRSEPPQHVLSLATGRFGDMQVVPCSEPIHWMGNVVSWLWQESRSMTPEVRPEKLGLIREPEHAANAAMLFPQTRGDAFSFTAPVKLSLHGGPPVSGRIYLLQRHLCFAEVPEAGAKGSLASSSQGSFSRNVSTPMMPSPRLPSPRKRSGTTMTGDEDGKSSSNNINLEGPRITAKSPSGSLKMDSLRLSDPDTAQSPGKLKLVLSLCDDVAVVDKDGEDGIVVRGDGGTWTVTVGSAQNRDSLWDAIRGMHEACANFNSDPNLPSVLVIDDDNAATLLVVAELLRHSLPTRVAVATFNVDRVPLFSKEAIIKVTVVADHEELLELVPHYSVLVVGSPQDPTHPLRLLSFLSALKVEAEEAQVPRVVVTAPLVREDCAKSEDSLLRSASVLVTDALANAFHPLQMCVIRFGPFLQDVFHSAQNLAAVGKLHLPIKDAASLLPLVDVNDFVECVRTVALYRPPELFFPGDFVATGSSATSVDALVSMASVVLDRQVSFCQVLPKEFNESYAPPHCAGPWFTETLSQWDGLEEASWESGIEAITGELPTGVPQFLYDAKAAVLDQGAPELMEELSRRWTTLIRRDASEGATKHHTPGEPRATGGTSRLSTSLTPLKEAPAVTISYSSPSSTCPVEVALAGFAEPTWSPLYIALCRGLSKDNAVQRDGWLAVMHLMHVGPDRVGAEWMFWVLKDVSEDNELSRATMQKILASMEDVWKSIGLRVNPTWCDHLMSSLFKDNALATIDLRHWQKRLLRHASLLHAADCLGSDISYAPWPEDKDVDSNRLAIIGPGHSEWMVVRNLLIAIRLRLGEAEMLPYRSLTPAASSAPNALLPVVLNLPPLTDDAAAETWTCTEPCPALFKRVRNVSGQSYNDMIRWLGPTQLLTCLLRGRMGGLQEVSMTGGRSGSLFFRSRNGRYLLKTLPPSEEALLVQLMPEYCNYLERHPESLLPRYLALMRLQSSGGKLISFLVMQSVFHGGKVEEQYDLKGSKVARKVGGDADPLVARKDLDLKETINVGGMVKRKVLAQLERDVSWLHTRNICDYSLLVGIGRQGKTAVDEAALQSVSDPKTVYYLGLIDTLTVYDLKKRGEHVYKSIAYNTSTDISAVDASRYRVRFLKYLDTVIQ